MAKDLWKAKGRKARSLGRKAGLFAINMARSISGSSANKENTRPGEDRQSDSEEDEDDNSEALLATAQSQLLEERKKVADAKSALKNAHRREKRAHAAKLGLQERLTEEDGCRRDLEASGVQLARSETEVTGLKARVQELTKKNKALDMKVRRGSAQRNKAVEKAKATSSTFHLKNKGVVSEPARELVMDLVSAYNVPVAHVDKLIKSVAETVGVTVKGSVSERTVGRVALEGGVIAQVQIIDELQHSKDLTISGDGTTLRHVNYESKFVNFKTSLYNHLAGVNTPPKRVQRFLGISTAVDHTAETQIQGWKDINEEMHEIYNSSAQGLEHPVDPDSLPARITGMNADHAPDQKKVGRGIGGVDGWKQEADRKIRGEKELRSWSRDQLLPFILAESAKKVADAGGIEAFNALPAAEQDTLNKQMFIKICRDVGKDVYEAMSPKDQRATDLFIWAGCCMHKELNAVKGGNVAMIASWLGHVGPIQLMNKDNAAAATAGPGDARTRAEEVSDAGGVKLTSLAGMLFNNKDKKKGQGDTFTIFFESKLGYPVNFPDTSNTRYQSHCEAAGALLLHLDIYVEFLEHIRDKKGNGTFTNMEKNIYDGLQDPATLTELAVLALYGQSVSHPYLRQVRGPEREHTNLLDLGPLHMQTLAHCRNIIANPDLLISPSATYGTGSMDGLPWDNPEVVYAVLAMIPRLPRVRESLVAFFTGALETWERFSEEYSDDGLIANATAGERERAWMPTTNDANEGALGELRNAARRAPNMSLHQLNARRMYKKNDTKIYRRRLNSKDHRMIRAKARMIDSSGLTKKRRMAQAKADAVVVVKKRAKDAEKVNKKIKANTALDKITNTLWLTEALILTDPETGKPRSNDALDSQLAWHRRDELSRLAKPADAKIPKVSKLTNKSLKIEALVAAVQRYNIGRCSALEMLQDGSGEVDADADGDITMGPV